MGPAKFRAWPPTHRSGSGSSVSDRWRATTYAMLDRTDTSVVAVCEPSAEAAAAAELFDPARAAGPAERARLAALRRDATPTSSTRCSSSRPTRFHFAQATACLEAGLDVLLEKPMVMTAAEADGPHRDARPDRAAPRRRVPGEPVPAGPDGVAAAPLRRARADPQYRRGGLAGLGGRDRRDVAAGPGALGRRLPVRHRRPHAEHRHGPRRRGRSPRSRPGSRTTAARSTSGPWSWPGSHRARSSR